MLAERFGVDFSEEIPFNDYANAGVFYADREEDTWEDIFLVDDYSALKKLGATDLDIQLYIAVSKFKFGEVLQLLENGAKPDAIIWADEEWSCKDRIGLEASYLGTYVYPILFEENDCSGSKSDVSDGLCNLIGLAAHHAMYNLLEPYCTKTE